MQHGSFHIIEVVVGRRCLSLGCIWALWHLLVDFRYNSGALGAVWPLEFFITYLLALTPYRLLMPWVYSHTQSLLLAILMHASVTGSLLVLVPVVHWDSIGNRSLRSCFGSCLPLFCEKNGQRTGGNLN
jgi:hypothetical protein